MSGELDMIERMQLHARGLPAVSKTDADRKIAALDAMSPDELEKMAITYHVLGGHTPVGKAAAYDTAAIFLLQLAEAKRRRSS